MELHLLPIITFFSVLFVASHGALSPEAYWNSVLPNTAMPKAVKDLLNPGHDRMANEARTRLDRTTISSKYPEKSTSVSVGKGGIHVYTGKGGTNVNVGHGSVGFHTSKGVTIAAGNRNYGRAASNTQIQYSKTRTTFFLEKDLVPGNSMSLEFTKTDGDATFLARSDAEKIPFSSNKMSEVFRLYDVTPESEEGQAMVKTVNECEEPSLKGEEKYCATSLESMVDFTTSKLGKNVNAIATEIDKETKLQKYTITEVSKKNDNEPVVCHKQLYPYPVFYCHLTHAVRAYEVSLRGADGTKGNAVAACHTDTSSWNPRHLAFQVLKVQPGTVPVCHYLQEDEIVWRAN